MKEKEIIGEMLSKLQYEKFCTPNNCFGCCGDGKIDITCSIVRDNFEKEFLKYYQPKNPEGSVVLSKEEYGEYVELRNSEVGELVKENRELGKQCLDWMKLYHKQLTKTNEARKETVKEVITEMFKQIEGYENIDVILNRIAKQFGVKVEE